MSFLQVDFSKTFGPIKPLHGINNSPLTYGDVLPELRAAGIPSVRLHDAGGEFGGTYFVDVPNIFPNFEADPDDPTSYDFAFTDSYLKGLIASGMNIFYRLGVTIENHHQIKAYRIHPPKDFQKWARICEGIIKHYNEGWANGFHYDITYWEIWNEPENPRMWTGTKVEYFELYRVASNHLKNRFPSIKIGGYGGCGFFALTRKDADDFQKGCISYFEDFLRFVTTPETSAPLDFFSWHIYTTDPYEIIPHAEYVDKKLKESGLTKTENILNEWNRIDWSHCDFEALKEMPGVVFTATAFCLMQNSPIDRSNYYDALPSREYCGLYHFPSLKLSKTYFAFRMFNELYKLGLAVECKHDCNHHISICAAKNDSDDGALLIVNSDHCEHVLELILNHPKALNAVLILDKTRSFEPYELGKSQTITVPAESLLLLRFSN